MNKKIKTYLACVALLLVAAFGFVPEQTFEGKTVNAPDYVGYLGMSQEANTWNRAHPKDQTAWTGSMFSGMPTIMITGNVKNDLTRPIFRLLSFKKATPASTIFLSLLGAFLLMLVLGLDPILAVGGAIAITFCAYNPQIIQVGHNTKMRALAFAPWVLAAVIFTYKKALTDTGGKWKDWLPLTLLGAVMTGFAFAFQVKANHVQITWYLGLIIAVYVIGLIVWICVSKQRLKALWGRFLTASALLLVLGTAGLATNACELLPTWEYTSQTTRGGSELSGQNNKGLSLEYSTAWSYGWNEIPNLIIPNFNGGPSIGPLPMTSKTAECLRKSNQNVRKELKSQPLYWGPQPNTAGPMYIGVISVFLFILGLMVCDGKDKWWMLAAALLAIGLALGNNLIGLTRFFHDHVPFYNKFRAVSMSLVILQLVVPALGFLGLKKVLDGSVNKDDFFKKGLIALGIVGGICLIFFIFPGLAGDFHSSVDSNYSESYAEALAADRKTLLRKDALVSLLFVSGAFLVLLWSFNKNRNEKTRNIAAVAMCLLVLVNLFGVGRRYLNASHFQTKRAFEKTLSPREVDKRMKEDDALSYRVADLTVDLFSDSKASYFHKSIGGYNAAKLRRYDDLINNYLIKEVSSVSAVIKESKTFSDYLNNLLPIPVLSMLNTKYFIFDDNRMPLQNPYAMGNAWFVDSALYTNTAEEEIKALGKTDLKRTAVLGPDFKNVKIPPAKSASDTLIMSSYAPNEVKYIYNASSPRAIIFSEIYYPIGWTARLENNTPLKIFRADWTLRGIIVPAGDHEITMRMDPPSYKKGAAISQVSSISLYILLLLAGAGLLFRRKDETSG